VEKVKKFQNEIIWKWKIFITKFSQF